MYSEFSTETGVVSDILTCEPSSVQTEVMRRRRVQSEFAATRHGLGAGGRGTREPRAAAIRHPVRRPRSANTAHTDAERRTE